MVGTRAVVNSSLEKLIAKGRQNDQSHRKIVTTLHHAVFKAPDYGQGDACAFRLQDNASVQSEMRSLPLLEACRRGIGF